MIQFYEMTPWLTDYTFHPGKKNFKAWVSERNHAMTGQGVILKIESSRPVLLQADELFCKTY